MGKINSRNKGNSCERKYAKIFREELGFPFCKTSRQASRLLDDSKVDLANLPLNIQIKKGYMSARPKPDAIFKEMKDCLAKNFPPSDEVHKKPKVLIHELNGGESIVSMNFEEWKEIYKNHLEYLKTKSNGI